LVCRSTNLDSRTRTFTQREMMPPHATAKNLVGEVLAGIQEHGGVTVEPLAGGVPGPRGRGDPTRVKGVESYICVVTWGRRYSVWWHARGGILTGCLVADSAFGAVLQVSPRVASFLVFRPSIRLSILSSPSRALSSVRPSQESPPLCECQRPGTHGPAASNRGPKRNQLIALRRGLPPLPPRRGRPCGGPSGWSH